MTPHQVLGLFIPMSEMTHGGCDRPRGYPKRDFVDRNAEPLRDGRGRSWNETAVSVRDLERAYTGSKFTGRSWETQRWKPPNGCISRKLERL